MCYSSQLFWICTGVPAILLIHSRSICHLIILSGILKVLLLNNGKLSEAATGGVLWKRCSEEFRKFHRNATVLKSLFIKAAGLQASNFVKKRLRYRCFSVKFAKRLITTILNNIRERLLLSFDIKNECKLIMNCTARKMKFSIKKFLQQMWPNRNRLAEQINVKKN